MYASVLTFQIQEGQRDEFVRLAQEQLVPELKRFKALHRAYVMTDAATNQGVRALETSEFYKQLAAQYFLPLLVPESMEWHVYELNIQASPDEAREVGT